MVICTYINHDINNDMKSFTEKVKEIVRKIPKGSVLTYAEVARRAGNARAARGVGSIMRANFDPQIPCHRVVSANGLGGYNRGGNGSKLAILRKEGVKI